MPGGSGAWLACVAAGAVALSGCSADASAPVVLPARSAGPAPVAPSAAFPTTAPGAAAFARHFFEVLDAAYLTGDTGELEPLVAPECDTCARMLRAIRRAYGAGGRFAGGRATVTFAEAPQAEGGRTTVDVIYRYDALTEHDRSGAVVSTEAAGTTEAAIDVVATATGWVVTGYRRIR